MRLTIRLPGSLAPIHESSFARYLAAMTISRLGSGMAQIALAFAVLEFGSATDLGIVLLAREIPIIVFVLLGGVYADRLPRRTILVATSLLQGAVQVITAVLLVTGDAAVWNIALLQMAFGVGGAFARPATIGLIKESVSDEHLQAANALSGLTGSVVSIAGPALGAILVTAGTPALAISIDAVTFFVAAAFMASMRLAPTARLAATSVLGDLRGGWREFISRPWAVAIVASFGLFQLTYFPALLVLGPIVALAHLGGPAAWGAILAVESAGAVLGGLLSLRIHASRPLVACQLAVLPAGVFLLGLAVPLPLPALVVMSAAVGIGFAVGNTLYQTAFQRNLPEYALSRISSYDWLGSIALNPLGYALIGPISVAIGTAEALTVSAILNIATILVVILVPSVRAISMHPPAAAVAEGAGAP